MRQVYEKDGILHVHSRFWHKGMPIMVSNSNIKGGPELYTNHPSYATWKPTGWIRFNGVESRDLFECDRCGEIATASHFCPECGAFMTIEEEKDDET